MIEYRRFRNFDTPKLVTLWHACELGRGAISGFSTDAFDSLNFAQPYFDPEGLILAIAGSEVVGFIHAGFATDSTQSQLDHKTGVICAVMVHPEFRHQGIGRQLISKAEEYLKRHGSHVIFAGPAPLNDPFYFGLYGGCQAAGFLDSDPNAKPFMQKMGYEPAESIMIYQRNISDGRDPVRYRLTKIRRSTELQIFEQPESPTWWWITHMGRLDSLRFRLAPKGGGQAFAAITVSGLDLYHPSWNERAVGLSELVVVESERRKGYGQSLLLEVIRRIRQELVTLVEAHAPQQNAAACKVLEVVGFNHVDTGTVFRRQLAE